MEASKNSTTTSKKNKADKIDLELLKTQENDIKNIIKQFDIFLLVYMLKAATNSEHAMSVDEVATQLEALIPGGVNGSSLFPSRTLRRKFDLFTNLTDMDVMVLNQINELLTSIIGGQVSYCYAKGIEDGSNTRSSSDQKRQKRFYFDPVLRPGDMDMISGSINSSRYLSAKEKEYLLARLRILFPNYEYEEDRINSNTFRRIDRVELLPDVPLKNNTGALPFDTSIFLSNVQKIHEAITEKYQIEVIYGTYDIADGSGKLDFHPRNENKPYVLNPYAMIWNDGEYYLIATHYNFKNPVHFRIDRIISVKAHNKTNKDGTKSLVDRKEIPSSLAPFFDKKVNPPVFDEIKYTNTYPRMGIYSNTNLIDCCFECTPISLQILIDNFGPNIRLKESPIKHDENEVDAHGNPQRYLSATIRNVQYDNALSFALSKANSLTLLSPPELVEDLRQKLSDIVKKYDTYNK